jgi:hypothetical protein
VKDKAAKVKVINNFQPVKSVIYDNLLLSILEIMPQHLMTQKRHKGITPIRIIVLVITFEMERHLLTCKTCRIPLSVKFKTKVRFH